MGSVIDTIECPNCKNEAWNDYYYRTGEEYTNCQNCGYHHSVTIKEKSRDKKELTEDDFKIVECANPFGAFRIKYKDEICTTCGSLRSKAEWKRLQKDVKEEEHYPNVEYFMLSQFIKGKIVITTIINNEEDI